MPPPLSSDALLALPEFRVALSDASLVATGLPTLPDLPPDLYDQARTHTSWYGFATDGFHVGSSRSGADPNVIKGTEDSPLGTSVRRPAEVRSEFERFEFLGDAILSTSLALLIYDKHPELAEGTMSTLKGALQANKTLAAISQAYGLQNIMRVHGSAETMKLNPDHPVAAKLFEAFLAAINHAYGLQSTIDFIHDIYKPSLLPTAYRLLAEHNATLIAQARESDTDPSSQAFVNYVGRLQEWGMRSGQRIEYRMLPSEGGRKGERLVHIGEIWVGGTKAAQERADTIKGVRQLLAKRAIDLVNSSGIQ